MAVGYDYGTAINVVARKDDEGKTVVQVERDCFIAMGKEFAEMINLDEYNYVTDVENGEEKIYIVGKDAIKLDNLQPSKDAEGNRISTLRRPMSKMVINSKTDKKAIKMLKHISQGLIGPPKYDGEICVLSIPASSLDGKVDNSFHASMCQGFIEELGYTAVPLNEALAVVYASNPKIETEDEGTLNFTGIGISFGGGGSNGCVAYKGNDTIRLSVAKGGDWIDEQVSSVTSLTSSQVTVLKERASREGVLNLSKPYIEDPKGFDEEALQALLIFYKNLITTVAQEFKKAFVNEKLTIDNELEVVISGGTSMPPGFDVLVEKVIREASWPFKIKGVRRAPDPMNATAMGCLNAAISKEKKAKQESESGEE
jgi:hypothetical protein